MSSPGGNFPDGAGESPQGQPCVRPRAAEGGGPMRPPRPAKFYLPRRIFLLDKRRRRSIMQINKRVDEDKVGRGSVSSESPRPVRGDLAPRLKFHLLSSPRNGFRAK